MPFAARIILFDVRLDTGGYLTGFSFRCGLDFGCGTSLMGFASELFMGVRLRQCWEVYVDKSCTGNTGTGSGPENKCAVNHTIRYLNLML